MGCEYKKCCFCVDLRIGSLIIGYFHLFGGLTVFAGSIVLFINGIKATTNNYVPVALLGANVVLMFLNALITVAMIIGVHKEQYRYLQPYLMYNALLVVFHVVDLSVSLAFGVVVVNIVSNIISILLTIYFLLVVRSYCLELKRQGTPMSPAVLYAPPVVYPTPAGYPAPGGYPASAPVAVVVYTDQPAQKQAYQDV